MQLNASRNLSRLLLFQCPPRPTLFHNHNLLTTFQPFSSFATMSQKALLLHEAKTPLVLAHNYPIPQPTDTQIQVKVTVAALNGHDQKVRDLGIFLSRTGVPAVLANDVVGTVVQVGSAVTSFEPGDRVVSQADFAHGTLQNGLQEYAVLDPQFTAKIPEPISDDDAATFPTNVIASLVALFSDLPIPAPWTVEAKTFDYRGATLLIIGGGSVAGRYATQLTKLAGIGRIVVVGGSQEVLRSYGATHVLSRHGGYDTVLGSIRAIVGDELLYAYDVVNMPNEQLLGLNALSGHKKGYFTRLLPLPIDRSKVLDKAAGFEVGNVLGISSERPELCREFWKRLPEYLEKKILVPIPDGYQVTSGLDADKVNEVLDSFRDGSRLRHAHVHL
jgi:NADPH2:quinone reductase